MSIKIAPSLLAADFGRLESEIAEIEDHADWLHLDIMDGHFVPNISFGIPTIEGIRAKTDLYFDCHLMTTNPGRFVGRLAEVGADRLSMHIEAISDPTSLATRVRKAGMEFGLAINPTTPFNRVAPFVELCDLVVVMSVEPGFGGQSFLWSVLPKIEETREWVVNRGLPVNIQVDGGINSENARQIAEAGASVLVAGSAVFGRRDRPSAIEGIRRAAENR